MAVKNEDVLGILTGYINLHGYSPTVQEVADMVGLRSKQSAWSHLQEMFENGMIETDAPGSPRAIRIPGNGVGKESQSSKKPKNVNSDYGFFDCPVCGTTIYADDIKQFKYCLECGKKLDWA